MSGAFSPGILANVDPKVAETIRQLWDRVNYLIGENQRLRQVVEGSSGAAGRDKIALPVSPDPLVVPGTVSGQIVAGTENWGAIPITLPAVEYTLTTEQGNNRTFRFGGANGNRNVYLPQFQGKMWIVSISFVGTVTFRIVTNPGATGTAIVGPGNGIIFCFGNETFLAAS